MLPEIIRQLPELNQSYLSQLQDVPSAWSFSKDLACLCPTPKFEYFRTTIGREEQDFGDEDVPRGHPVSIARVNDTYLPRNTASEIHNPESLHLDSVSRRALPPRDVTDNTIDEAYVTFILYCNPAIPSNVDTTELRRGFRAPPKSDGQTFSIYKLFELIRKLEHKELKTWAQLAIELGVIPPAIGNGQSTQKIQQYAVRLKRWMHAMHVDAFFEYLLEKGNSYWTDVPSDNNVHSEFGRAGVPAEEDLALRALLPETRPKRGRKRLEDHYKTSDGDLDKSPAQREKMQFFGHSDDFGVGESSIIDTRGSTYPLWPDPAPQQRDLGSRSALDEINYQFADASHRYSQPCHLNKIPWSKNSESSIFCQNIPCTAVVKVAPPDSSRFKRRRRRPGPVISSAWPSSSTVTGSKLRGRPPTNRSVTDGPFSIFPSNPNAEKGLNFNRKANANNTWPYVSSAISRSSDPSRPSLPLIQNPEQADGLELAEHLIDPVRINTSDINTYDELETPNSQKTTDASLSVSSDYPTTSRDIQSISCSQVSKNSNVEAFRLDPKPGDDMTNIREIEKSFIRCIQSAEFYGIDGAPCAPCSTAIVTATVRQLIRNLRAESSSKETFLMNLSTFAVGNTLTKGVKVRALEDTDQHAVYLIMWTLQFGCITGSTNIRCFLRKGKEYEEDFREIPPLENSLARGRGEQEQDESAEDWKKKFFKLRAASRLKDAKIDELKSAMLNSVMVVKDCLFNDI